MSDTETLSADLLTLLIELKRIRRTGWLDRGATPDSVESVADHSYLTALIAWLTALDRPELDAGRVLKLAMVHDIAEAIIGDLPPYESDEVPGPGDPDAVRAFFSVRHLRSPEQNAAKHAAEAAAFDQIARLMPGAARAEFSSLWQEYEARQTPEARFVKDADTLEAFLESLAQAQLNPGLPVGGFADMAQKEIDDPSLQAIRDAAIAATLHEQPDNAFHTEPVD